MKEAALRAVGWAWDAANVGHKGTFSAERLQQLHNFTLREDSASRSSWVWASTTSFFTPVPCLVFIMLSEALPLTSPLAGPKANGVFWIRAWFVQGCYTYAFFMVLLYCIPEIPRRFLLLLPISAVISAGHTAVHFLIASTLGFPVPFSSLVLNTPWIVFIVIALWFYIGPPGLSSKQMRLQLRKFAVAIYAGSSLAIVYPVFYYVFLLANSYPRAQVLLTVVVLPAIKLLEKLLLYQATSHLPDLQPTYIAFNVEVFNGLFISSCMRNNTSTMVTSVLITVDFLSLAIALYGLRSIIVEIDKLKVKAGPSLARVTMLGIALVILSEDNSIASNHSYALHNQNLNFSNVLKNSLKLKRISTAIVPIQPSLDNCGNRKSLSDRKLFKIIVAGAVTRTNLSRTTPTSGMLRSTKCSHQVVQTRGPTAQNNRHLSTSTACGLSVDERQRFVLDTCRVLRRLETLLIVEYIEVIVPVLYGKIGMSSSATHRLTVVMAISNLYSGGILSAQSSVLFTFARVVRG
ncbi:unnamed protein product [Phytophthora fragariaefolia]|uniref:Unnamed protein product n=1 Tax=Phytophthora fragariaefolia TaxID=1490495 RepID=A0A9W7D6S5_9STRA|nr:unnamed protein product [Phytophthora fragariaefolia]